MNDNQKDLESIYDAVSKIVESCVHTENCSISVPHVFTLSRNNSDGRITVAATIKVFVQ